LPALKAAADNPDGTFMSAAAEAGPEDSEEETGRRSAPVMTEAVGPLVTATSLDQPTGGRIYHQAVCPQKIYTQNGH
jgi:hypothetical protein